MEITKENLEQLSANLTRYYLHGGRVVVYCPADATRDTVDVWFREVQETAKAWPSEQPYFEIHDMRETVVTPYNRAKAMELVGVLDSFDIQGYAAVVIAESRAGELMGFFINRVFSRFNRKIKRRVFTSMEEALIWLESIL